MSLHTSVHLASPGIVSVKCDAVWLGANIDPNHVLVGVVQGAFTALRVGSATLVISQ